MFQFWTKPAAMTARSRERTCVGTRKSMSTAAPVGTLCAAIGVHIRPPRTHVTKADTIIYRSSQHDCGGCAMKNQCCPNMPFRKIARSVHENARDVARKLAVTPEFKQSRRERKKVELFAHRKRILKLDRLRLRG
ncbi:hypothetical protein RM96_13310 [Cupriavidus sp. IDO]|nr:hypothetical protein RM96_13310 [Cupriavidus sp. IDO]